MVSRETLQKLAEFEFDPLNDAAFKFLLGSEQRKHITLAFLNAVLEPWIGRTIKDLEFLPTEMIPENNRGKLTRLDVACRLDGKETVNVEVQVKNNKDMDRRTVYYWSQLYQNSLKKSGHYEDLQPAITINILNYTLFQWPEYDPHDIYVIYSPKYYRCLNNDMQLHFLELPKYRNLRRSKKNPIAKMSPTERWLAFFANNLDIDEQEELAMTDAAINSAMDESRIFLHNNAEQRNYINHKMALLDYRSEMKHSYEDGIAKGLEDGIERGVEKVAITMLKNKFTLDQIQLSTSLSQSQIEQIAKDNDLM